MADFMIRFRITPGAGTYLQGDVHIAVLGAPDQASALACAERYLRREVFTNPGDSFRLDAERVENAATSQLERGYTVRYG